MWLPAAASRQRPRPRHRLLLLPGAVALILAFSAGFKSRGGAQTDAATAFVGVRPPTVQPVDQRLGRVARRAEEEEAVDAESSSVVTTDEKPTSVFDGSGRKFFRQVFKKKPYLVFRANWTYALKDETGQVVERGPWARAWNMPEKDFKIREKSLKQKYRAKKRKLRIKHGMGQKWPNGKYIFLAKLQGSPFTRQQYGEKYVGWKAWSKKSVERRAQRKRANDLKTRLMIEAEETRLERLSQLQVWPGEKEWKKPFDPTKQYDATWKDYKGYMDEKKSEEEDAGKDSKE